MINNDVANATLSSSTTSSSTVKQEGESNQLPSYKIKRKNEKKNMRVVKDSCRVIIKFV